MIVQAWKKKKRKPYWYFNFVREVSQGGQKNIEVLRTLNVEKKVEKILFLPVVFRQKFNSPDFKFDDPKLILEIEPGLLFSIYGRDGFVAVRFSRHRLLMSIWGVLFCFNRTLLISVEIKKRFTGSSSGGAITK